MNEFDKCHTYVTPSIDSIGTHFSLLIPFPFPSQPHPNLTLDAALSAAPSSHAVVAASAVSIPSRKHMLHLLSLGSLKPTRITHCTVFFRAYPTH
ncbi:unnamed protein product [Sphenostylis stenocarpa]|uniref:Uncharacterized protein n=1 Tax=Sphenostylis stenocarpa TaxID=92480 RepID=A0AA86W051_9FABA|nr:unnamed protein product [Sphenostylis stenocarpa]